MNDFIAGSCSGFAQTIIGHPFDTVKVILQNRDPFSFKTFPVRDYFRGILFPIGFSVGINAISFTTYQHYMNHYTNQECIAGFIAGLFITPFVHLQDIGKIHRQLGHTLELKHFMSRHGLLSTITRETIAMSTYFGTYHWLKKKHYNPIVAGGLAGLANWTLTYPLDVIRSRVYGQHIGMVEAYHQGYMWRGYSFCAVRAILVNATGFYVYEECKKYISEQT